MLGGNNWGIGGAFALGNGDCVTFVAETFASASDIFVINADSSSQIPTALSASANTLRIKQDFKGMGHVEHAAGVAHSWTAADYTVSDNEQRVIIESFMAISRRLYPSRAAVVNEITGQTCGGVGGSDMATASGMARITGG